MVNDELKSLLDDKVWHSYRVRLTFFALTEIKEQFWNGAITGPLLDGKEPADFASETLIGVLSGDEPWNSDQYKLLTHLFFAVKKKIRNAVRRHDATRVFHVDDDDEFGSEDKSFSLNDEIENEDLIDGFLRFLEGEDDLQLLIYCMKEGKLKRSEIAESLGLSPSDVTNLGKRLHRKAEEYKRQAQTIRRNLG